MTDNTIIKRNIYLDKIVPYIDHPLIKILTGQRRVGKSCILKSVEQLLRQRLPQENYIIINLEDYAFAHINNADDLHQEIISKFSENQKNYIFIDEIQEIENFDKVLRSLAIRNDIDIYVTGSNSAMLSAEMASRLAGRSVEIKIHPLSYPEFLEFHNLPDSDNAIDLYIRYGGLPYLRNLPQNDTWQEYLVNITDAIVYRDVVTRHSLRNNDFLQRLISFHADNIGRIFTAKKIADYLKSQKTKTSVSSVLEYTDRLCEAFIINKVHRWDIMGKKLFEIGEKYYFEDIGIRNAIIGYRPGDIGQLIENLVYNKLISDDFSVSVGVLLKDKEIDFIAEKGGERKYIQVALRVDDKSTAEREFGNLRDIPDNYEKLIVTLRDSAPNSLNGIKMISLREFLL